MSIQYPVLEAKLGNCYWVDHLIDGYSSKIWYDNWVGITYCIVIDFLLLQPARCDDGSRAFAGTAGWSRHDQCVDPADAPPLIFDSFFDHSSSSSFLFSLIFLFVLLRLWFLICYSLNDLWSSNHSLSLFFFVFVLWIVTFMCVFIAYRDAKVDRMCCGRMDRSPGWCEFVIIFV